MNTKFAFRSLRSTTALTVAFSLSAAAGWSQEIVSACDIENQIVPCVASDQYIETQADFEAAFDAGLVRSGDAGSEAQYYLVNKSEADGTFAIELIDPTLAADLPAELKAELDAQVAVDAAAAEANAAAAAEEITAAEIAAELAAAEAAAEVAAAEAAAAEEAAEETAAAEEAVAEVVPDVSEAEAEAIASGVNPDPVIEDVEADPLETVLEAELADESPQDDPAAAEQLVEEVAPTPEETVEDAPVIAAASGEAEADAEITTEEVAEGDVRTADQDFETSVTGDVAATTDATETAGLSNFERAILLGLGAVAIGSILDNGDEVVSNSGDRIVVQSDDGQFRVLKDDDVLLRQPGSQIQTEQFGDGSTRTIVTREDGSQVITIRAADGRVLRRALVQIDGTQVELFDDTQAETAVDVSTLPQQKAPTITAAATEEELRQALAADLGADLGRTFSLRQVRNIKEVRELAPVIELDAITFRTGSAAIQPDQARQLAMLGTAIRDYIDLRHGAVFLIEGHTDAVGDAGYNLALSDRRAETVALALTEYFDVPPANLITQGYGEAHLKVRTLDSEQANRRAVVRNISRLLR